MRKWLIVLFVMLTIVLLVSVADAGNCRRHSCRATPTPTRYSQDIPRSTPRSQPTQSRPCVITESYYNCGGLVIGASTPYATEIP